MRKALNGLLLVLYRWFCWSLVLIGMVPMVHASTPPEWNKGAYAYSAEQTPLSTVLTDFANSHGVYLTLGNINDTEVTAKIRADTPTAFLNRLALEHRFQWFVYNNTLYVSPQDEQGSVRLEISQEAVPDLKQALNGIGLLDPRFGWGELPEEGVVLVTGPQAYIDLIRNFSQQREKKDERRKVMVFPLRYASVSDRTLQYRDQRIVIPGVATILSELMDSKGSVPVGAAGATSALPDAGMDAMRESTRSILNKMAMGSDSGRRGGEGRGQQLSGRISADVRNNALLVRDDEKRRSEYQQLVENIDVPQNLVNIDAIILDVDRSALSRLAANWEGQLGNVSTGSSMKMGRSTLFINDFKRFFADVQALEGEGTASIVANPSVLTMENQPAIVDFNRTAFITAVGERVAQIQPVTAGTSLQVTPRVVQQGTQRSIQLVIDIEDGTVETDNEGKASGVKRGTVSTQALIGENRALVLGGFHVEESGDRDHRIPILGDIPLLGKMFTSTRYEVSRRERLFILTPHLVGDQTDPVRYVSEENRSQLNGAMNRVAKRNGNTDLYSLVENAMRDLASRQFPVGFQQEDRGARLSEVCRSQRGLIYDSERYQWYSNGLVKLSVGVVRNSGSIPQRVDEAACASNQTLAVAVWPKTTLGPGESSEIFLALEPTFATEPVRPSLVLGQ
ncbi:type III secretion system outer membrane ring subunit SctC [Brenneria rubrifaciens]|uniref:Type 3 secretion system secretin n=1 Tax=Brenneria rubrifaciens TaxID=55213 RepID=A0A4P8QNL6_9GAMM|nr:type III secretion system outer membrane ring subunit SctC [Brenneria rubrifaciens]QCR08548.1 EscC/YscC/HrcC family type III secretion system outer membrane ring protein [Brenneria rubrifaciens]